MTQAVTLCAADLWSKFGFWDGDVFTCCDWADEQNYMEWSVVHNSDYDPLVAVVRKYLLPAIEQAGHVIEVEEIGSIHNPIRVKDASGYDEAPDWAHGVEVTVTLEQVKELMQ